MTTIKAVCPGHEELFHRYKSRENAKAKAAAEVANLEKKDGILNAKYKIISAKSPTGKESGLFGGLNKIFFNHAVMLQYQHKNNCKECSFQAEKIVEKA